MRSVLIRFCRAPQYAPENSLMDNQHITPTVWGQRFRRRAKYATISFLVMAARPRPVLCGELTRALLVPYQLRSTV